MCLTRFRRSSFEARCSTPGDVLPDSLVIETVPNPNKLGTFQLPSDSRAITTLDLLRKAVGPSTGLRATPLSMALRTAARAPLAPTHSDGAVSSCHGESKESPGCASEA